MGKGEEKVNRRLALIISHKDAENTRCYALPFRVFRVFVVPTNQTTRTTRKAQDFQITNACRTSLFVYSLYSVVPSFAIFSVKY